MNKQNEKQLLNTGDVLVVAFGAMIGWGWVVSSGQWITNGGVFGTTIGFIIGGIMIYFVGLCYAELTTALPKCGGEHVFSYKAFGSIGAYICTWSIILSYIGVVCYEAVSFPTVLQYLFPNLAKVYLYTIGGFDVYLSWLLIATSMVILILLLNIVGTKKAARFQKILTCIIAGVGILLVVGAVFSGDINNLQEQMFVGETNSQIIENVVKVAIMTPFFFFGFDVIPQAAEEINVPLKKLGKMMILSIVMAVSFYVMVVLSVGYIMSAKQISNSMSTTGLGRSMLVWIVDAGNFACCLAYCIVSMSFLMIRKKDPNLKRPYKVNKYRVVGLIAVTMSGVMTAMYIIPGTNCTLVWQEWGIVGGWCLLGGIMAFLSKRKYGEYFASNIE